MIAVKVQCGCGQRYAFDVEPVHGRMPSPVACPVCGADGTGAANQIIAQALPAPPAPAPVAAAKLRMPVAASAPPEADAPVPAAALRHSFLGSESDTWKWWYFVLAGICIGGYSIWQAYDQHRMKPLGELFFAVFCVAIGIWDFQHKRKKRAQG